MFSANTMPKTLHFQSIRRTPPKLLRLLCMATAFACLAACSPKYNWREVHGKDAPFVALFPDKPVTVTRAINLDGQQVNMTMTAAEVDGVSFAVGYVTLANTSQSAATLHTMKTAMLRNIGGKLQGKPKSADVDGSEDIEALGSRNRDGGQEPLLLLGHFAAKGDRVYQVIVLGSEAAVLRDEARTFLTSFQPG
jgi:hypothetical protein